MAEITKLKTINGEQKGEIKTLKGELVTAQAAVANQKMAIDLAVAKEKGAWGEKMFNAYRMGISDSASRGAPPSGSVSGTWTNSGSGSPSVFT